MPFQFKRLEIPEVILVEARAFGDHRGFFMETYKRSEFLANGIGEHFVQDNYSRSHYGVLRGLHFQKLPKAQGKLVGVIQGKIFDVAVDLRKDSPTFGQWVGVELSSENRRMLYVPVGFAHGFCALSETADVVYKVTEDYAPELDRGVIWNDSDIKIRWPISNPILSEKDAQLLSLRQVDTNFLYERGKTR
jgi:dTDP-4-dehydrorhamnose 3,5-epimerase